MKRGGGLTEQEGRRRQRGPVGVWRKLTCRVSEENRASMQHATTPRAVAINRKGGVLGGGHLGKWGCGQREDSDKGDG